MVSAGFQSSFHFYIFYSNLIPVGLEGVELDRGIYVVRQIMPRKLAPESATRPPRTEVNLRETCT